MRFVQSNSLKPGMVLARNLYGFRNELLLSEGITLTESLIDKLNLSGCDGAYIHDSWDEFDTGGIISNELKSNTVCAVRSYFTGIVRNDSVMASQAFDTLKFLLDDIIDEIMSDTNAMVNIVDLKVFDEYTYFHSVNVAALAIMVGMSAGMNRTELYKLGMGAILHDIGKLFIPKEILNKPGPLTSDEFEIMKKHPHLGSEYLKKQNSVPTDSVIAVLTHHERYDSKGYPLGLPANKQIIEGKIIAICDNYDAMTSDRPYRKAYSPSEAMEHLMGNSGVMFDPDILNIFIKKIVLYPVGTVVSLSNGEKGTVIGNHPGSIMRPVVRLLSDSETEGTVIYDLYNDPALLCVTVTGIDRTKESKV
jgi:HD-GYP domain-containing protein (c-di-GMP phosphodiesterase class II)